MNTLQRVLLISLGSTALLLGIIGIFLPLLPTTPFLLLAAACYARASVRFYHWLISNRYLGGYILDYRQRKGINRRNRAITLSLLWFSIGISVIFTDHLWLKALLAAIAVAVSIHVIKLRALD